MKRPPENPPIAFRKPVVPRATLASDAQAYAELQCTTNFSFLRGASHPGELVIAAKAMGLNAIGVADRNTLAGVVRAHAAAKKEGLRLLVGARIDTLPDGFLPRHKNGKNERLSDSAYKDAPPGFSCLLYPTDRAAWGRLCTLLTKGKRIAPKGECHLTFDDLLGSLEGQAVIVIPPEDGVEFSKQPSRPPTRPVYAGPPSPRGGGLECASSYTDPKKNTQNLAGYSPPPYGEGGALANGKSVGWEARCLSQIQSPEPVSNFITRLTQIARVAPGRTWLAASMLYRGDDRRRLIQLARLSKQANVPLLATNDVHYHLPERRPLQDVITCIREKCTLETAGFKLAQNAERHLKPPHEMARLFADYPEAITATQDIAQRCTFSLDELAYHYPGEPVPPGKTPQQHLEDLTWEGAKRVYPDGVPNAVKVTLIKELQLIKKLDYAPYFLTVNDIVAYARSVDILCQGRGSAANSAVCYVLGITSVDPSKISLLFERFLSEERREPPDIDVDFEHERREEVIQYIYRRYGRHRAALAATIITYRPRSAVREVGKAMGLSEDVTSALASTVWGSWGKDIPEQQIKETGLDLADPHLARTVELTHELLGFPRHLSQHVGGFVLTEDALEETVPIGNAAMDERTFIEWDKDDIEELKIMKVDVLALGMLSCIRKCFDLLRAHYRLDYNLANLPREDAATYEMLQRGDSLGTFQVESRAQMNMLPRLKPKEFYDLVIQVAIVRPGPIQGDMVHPYLRRRDGLESVRYPYPSPDHGPKNELKNILGRTLGVPLFQEQAMQIAIDAAKFTPDEANLLRRAMATFRRVGTIHTLQEKMVGRMIERGYEPDFARRCFDQIKGFGEYGFPESHAASFAHLVYVSSWLKCHFPDVFCAGLLNAQPMGFYAPAQIVRDAREHAIEVRPIDVNFSHWDNALEENHDGSHAVRLGFRQADGLRRDVMEQFLQMRAEEMLNRHRALPFTSLEHLRRRTGLSVATLERLAANDAFRSLGLDRRQALWTVRGLVSDVQLPLFAAVDTDAAGPDVPVALPAMRKSEHVVADYQTHRLSLKAHPLSFLRDRYRRQGMIAAGDLLSMRNKQRCTLAGVVLVRQRPGTAKGVLFMTLEDETGVANIVVWKKVWESFRQVVMTARLVKITGEVQRSGDVIHVVGYKLEDLTDDLDHLSEADFPEIVARADHVRTPLPSHAGGVSSQAKKRARLEAAGRGIDTIADHVPIPLAHADEVRHPQNERGGRSRNEEGIPLHVVTGPGRAKLEKPRKSPLSRRDPKPLPAADPPQPSKARHPRNVRVIPKSRDFH